MKKKEKVYVADFETRCSDYDIAIQETSVWLWDICSIDTLEHITGDSIETFFEQLKKMERSVIYFHNLGRFDGFFILDYILNQRFKYKPNGALKTNQYTALIDEFGKMYNIELCLDDGKRKHKQACVIEFRDSLNKINASEERIAKDYNLPISKGSIDYTKYRDKEYKATEEEIEYIKTDTEIVARVIKLQYENGMEYLTSASDTFHAYQARCGAYFKSIFPVLPIEVDDYIRNSYRGGICLVNPKYQGKIIEKRINVYDVNSMYPKQMCDELLPYGEPIYVEGEIKPTQIRPLYIQRIEFCGYLKKGHMPNILIKGNSFSNEYLTDTEGGVIELTLTNIDLELMKENYYIDSIKYIDGYAFMGSRNLFESYIRPLYEKKCRSRGAQKQLYKILINALYGKFAMSHVHIRKEPYLENGIVMYAVTEKVNTKPVYTAVASFITAYARKQLFGVINEHLEAFVYCDTDSVHLCEETLKESQISDSELGLWKLEKVYTRSKYLGTKRYYGEKEEGKIDVKLAGCPENVKQQITIDNFTIGSTFMGKLLPMKVRGGVILVPTNFTIKPQIGLHLE